MPQDFTTDDSHNPFLVGATGGAGLTAKQVRHRRFTSPTRGVRLLAQDAENPALLARSALLAAPDTALLSDASAARAYRLPLPRDVVVHAPVSVAVPRDHVRQRRGGVRGRRLTVPPEHQQLLEGAWVTTPARTWIDCAQFLRPEDVVAMGDAILHRGLATFTQLEHMVRWGRGRRGIVRARDMLPLLDARSESPSESIVRYHLIAAGLPRPCCNFDIVVDGEWLARADLAWPDYRVIVEYDGVVHASDAARKRDAARRNLLQDRGWLVIVFTARDLARPHEMVALVRSALASRRPS